MTKTKTSLGLWRPVALNAAYCNREHHRNPRRELCAAASPGNYGIGEVDRGTHGTNTSSLFAFDLRACRRAHQLLHVMEASPMSE